MMNNQNDPSSLNDTIVNSEKDDSVKELLNQSNDFAKIEEEFKRLHYSEVVKIQAVIRRRLIMPHFQMILKLHRKRTRVVNEIWNSETTYLEGLMTLSQLFQLPLRKIANEQNSFITKEQVDILFFSLPELMETSKKMISIFAKACSNFSPHSKFGEIFIQNSELLKSTFTPYADNYDDISNLLQRLRKDDRFLNWIRDIEYKKCDLNLESYLIMPIQRITRYVLLLKELVHQTWQDHADYQSLIDAVATVEKVAQHVNEHKRKLINAEKIKTIQSQISGMKEDLTLNEDRVYITEGMVKELDTTVPLSHYIFLFNDVMVWTQLINKKKFVFRKLNWLNRTTAEPDKLNSLRVITDEWTTCIYTNKKEEQNKWLAYLENENYSPQSKKPTQKRPDIVFLNKQTMLNNQLKEKLESMKAKRNSKKDNQHDRNSLREKKKSPKKLKVEEKETEDKLKNRKANKIRAATIDSKILTQHRQLADLMKQSFEKQKESKRSSYSPPSPKSSNEKDSIEIKGNRSSHHDILVHTKSSKKSKSRDSKEIKLKNSDKGEVDETSTEQKKKQKKKKRSATLKPMKVGRLSDESNLDDNNEKSKT